MQFASVAALDQCETVLESSAESRRAEARRTITGGRLNTRKMFLSRKIDTELKLFPYSCRSSSRSMTKATMAKTRTPITKPAAYRSNMAMELRHLKMVPGQGGTKVWLRGCGSCAPARVQAQHSLCLINERAFGNRGQLERVKSRYMPRQYCLIDLTVDK
jgi:hypothetical protein